MGLIGKLLIGVGILLLVVLVLIPEGLTSIVGVIGLILVALVAIIATKMKSAIA